MPYFVNESVLTICCLSRPPSLRIYTAATKVYTISRIRLWSLGHKTKQSTRLSSLYMPIAMETAYEHFAPKRLEVGAPDVRKNYFLPTYGFLEADFFENKPLMMPQQPSEFSDLVKRRMKCEELFNKYFCKNKINYLK